MIAPVLKLPVDLFGIAGAVAEQFKLHEAHARDRACVDVGEYFAERAAALRAGPTLQDPIAWTLTQRCHMQDGVVYAAPHLVAAVAYEVIATVLSFGDPTRPLDDRAPDLAGQDRTDPAVTSDPRTETGHEA